MEATQRRSDVATKASVAPPLVGGAIRTATVRERPTRAAGSSPRNATEAMKRRLRRHGFSLAEALLSIVIVGGLVVAALNTTGAAVMARSKMSDHGRAQLLAQDLMAEILSQNYEEPVDAVLFGLETGESGASRINYDDVDDYNGWAPSSTQAKDGTPLPDLQGWTRSVVVTWVNTSDGITTLGTESGLKRITVTVMHDGELAASISALRAGTRQSEGTVKPLGDPVISEELATKS